MVMGFAPAPDGMTRVGVIAGRRYHRRAVRRNRARRQLREAFRLLQGAVNEPAWVVLIARRGLRSGLRTQDVQAELLQLLEEARLLRPR
jgi:ribonuclease P protein component